MPPAGQHYGNVHDGFKKHWLTDAGAYPIMVRAVGSDRGLGWVGGAIMGGWGLRALQRAGRGQSPHWSCCLISVTPLRDKTASVLRPQLVESTRRFIIM